MRKSGDNKVDCCLEMRGKGRKEERKKERKKERKRQEYQDTRLCHHDPLVCIVPLDLRMNKRQRFHRPKLRPPVETQRHRRS